MNLLIVTCDDMRYDEFIYMPKTRRLLGRTGTTFTGCRTEASICSPSRAAILTGQSYLDHGVTTQADVPDLTTRNNNAFKALDNAGYRCGFIGKFFTAASGGSVAAGFDFWRGLTGDSQDAYDYTIWNGTAAVAPGIHQDEYLSGEALTFLDGAEPWCLWYCPTSPHWPNENPPDHTTEWAYREYPVTVEADVSDKPSWIQAQTAPTASELAETQEEERLRLRELLAVDDAISSFVSRIATNGQTDDTTIIFCSDNGVLLGEHRIMGDEFARATKKNMVYDQSMRVPLVCVGPDFPHQTVTAPATLMDVTATLLDLGGATSLLSNQVGVSLVDIATTPASYTSRQLLHYRDSEGPGTDDGWPDAEGITTATRKLWRHQGETGTDEFEMYDLDSDPHELTNVANDAGRLTERNALEASLDALLA